MIFSCIDVFCKWKIPQKDLKSVKKNFRFLSLHHVILIYLWNCKLCHVACKMFRFKFLQNADELIFHCLTLEGFFSFQFHMILYMLLNELYAVLWQILHLLFILFYKLFCFELCPSKIESLYGALVGKTCILRTFSVASLCFGPIKYS